MFHLNHINLNYNLFPFRMSIAEEVDVDKIINKLLENGGKDVKLLESEVRGLCLKAR